LCGLEGYFEFDAEGRGGIATLSEFKRREKNRLAAENGNAYLFYAGNLFGKDRTPEKVLKIADRVPFDGIFLSETDISLLEKNSSNPGRISALLTSKKNLIGIQGEKRIQFGNLTLLFSEHFTDQSSGDKINAKLIFSPPVEIPGGIVSEPADPPEIYFIRKNDLSSYSYKRGIFYAYCTDKPGEVGKLNLYFRNGKLIRNRQEFIYLNSMNSNRSWIDPNLEVQQEMK
ncbi:MAG: hypothetical protein K8R21_06355, partial [Leptospira sp.]|nr:hypothetical protein [Leptospira sp.]